MTQHPAATGTPRRIPQAMAAGATVASTATALGTLLARVAYDAWAAASGPVPAAPADVLVGLVAAAGSALCLWLGAGFVLSLGAALPGRMGSGAARVSERVTPLVVRRVAATVLGGALIATGAAPALATTATRPVAVATSVAARAAVDTGPTASSPSAAGADPQTAAHGSLSPDLLPSASPTTVGPSGGRSSQTVTVTPTTVAAPGLGAPGPPSRRLLGTAPEPPEPSHGTSTRGSSVTVAAGDTLWDIASTDLGPQASPAVIDREWHRWFATNREVVGPDPDHIEPGQVLEAPSAVPEGSDGSPTQGR